MITVQGGVPDTLPDALDRADIALIADPHRGLSHNRNCGLAAAKGTLVLFNDDDIALDMAGITQMRGLFAADPTLALALGWRTGEVPKRGRRTGSFALTRFTAGHASAPGLMVRRTAVLGAGVTFDPAFGVGAPAPIGEDYIFVTDLLRAGLKGRGVPIETGAHPHPSTGDDWHNPDLMRARRAMLARVFGPVHPLVRAAYTLRHRHRFSTAAAALRFALGQDA